MTFNINSTLISVQNCQTTFSYLLFTHNIHICITYGNFLFYHFSSLETRSSPGRTFLTKHLISALVEYNNPSCAHCGIKRWVERGFHRSTRNILNLAKIKWKLEWSVLTLGSLRLPCQVWKSVMQTSKIA